MSLLIKALKQAERDHQARTDSASAQAEAPADAQHAGVLPKIALQLDPLEAADPSENRAAQSLPYEPLNAHAGSAGAQSDSASAFAALNGSRPAALVPTTLAGAPAPGAAEAPAQAIAGSAVGAGSAISSGSALFAAVRTAAAAPAPAGPSVGNRASAAPAAGLQTQLGSKTREAAAHDDGRDDERAAARHLMAPDPERVRVRRQRMLLSAAAGLVLAALGYALWQTGLLDVWNTPSGAARVRLSAPGSAATPAVAAPAAGDAPITQTRQAQTPIVKAPVHAAVAAVEPAKKAAPQLDSAKSARSVAEAPEAASKVTTNADVVPAAGGIHLRPLDLSPEKIRSLLQDAYSAAARGDMAAAKKGYEQIIEVDRNNGDAWIGLATLAINSGDSVGATHYYRRALEIDPSDSVALAGLLGLQAAVEPQEYEARLRQYIVHDGAQPVLLAALGKLLARQGRWLEAQEVFFQAFSADPTQPDVAFNLAVSLERIHQPDAAVSFYRRALQLSQNHGSHFDQGLAKERIAALSSGSAAGAAASGAADAKASAVARK